MVGRENSFLSQKKKVEKLLDLEKSPFGNHNLNNGFKKEWSIVGAKTSR